MSSYTPYTHLMPKGMALFAYYRSCCLSETLLLASFTAPRAAGETSLVLSGICVCPQAKSLTLLDHLFQDPAPAQPLAFLCACTLSSSLGLTFHTPGIENNPLPSIIS